MAKYIKGKKLPKGISQRKDDGKFWVCRQIRQTASAAV